METLLERASRVVAHHPAPALPIDELQRLVRGSGVVVGEEALVRALFGGTDRFRLLDPWRGPWAPVRRWAERRERVLRRSARRGSRPWDRGGNGIGGSGIGGSGRVGDGGGGAGDDGRPGPFSDVGRRWVVARPGTGGDGGDRSSLRRMRQTLSHLGWTLDENSPRDLARWCLLVREGARLRDRIRRG